MTKENPEKGVRSVVRGVTKVTPGKCRECDSDDVWASDGRGQVYCVNCDTCKECGQFESHATTCKAEKDSCDSCEKETEELFDNADGELLCEECWDKANDEDDDNEDDEEDE